MIGKNNILSIVVSVYNEEDVLNVFYEMFHKITAEFQWKYELIFVNDGSHDRSREILDVLAKKDENVKVIHFSRNFGHEAAMIAGIDNAVGDGIICMDADLQHPLECIFPIVDKFNEGYEVISMVRTANKSAGILKNITSKAFYKIINILSNQTSFKENASDFFAISKNVANVLKNNYREKNRFLRGYVQCVGFQNTTLEYTADKRAGGESHYNFRKLLKFSLNTIVCFSDFPLKISGYMGLLSALTGAILLIYTLFTYKGAPSGYATIVIMMCFFFSVLFIVLGIIGEYLAILFSELKDRPIYIIDEKENFKELPENEETV